MLKRKKLNDRYTIQCDDYFTFDWMNYKRSEFREEEKLARMEDKSRARYRKMEGVTISVPDASWDKVNTVDDYGIHSSILSDREEESSSSSSPHFFTVSRGFL